jgi:hypothetical protein
MSSTFPVHSICFRAGWSSVENMSASRTDPQFSSGGSVARRTNSGGDLLSPGISSLSSSSTHPQNFNFEEVKSAWDFPGVEKLGSLAAPTTMSWRCGWCQSSFRGWNATKVMSHCAKASKTGGRSDIKLCTGRIPKETLDFFRSFRQRAIILAGTKRQQSDTLTESIADNQTSISVAFASKRSRVSSSGGSSMAHVDLSGDGEVGVEACNATRLTTAIADFVYCKGLSFSAVEGDHFAQILKLSRLVPTSYRPPGRKLLSTDLLDLSYENRLARYMKSLAIDADVFGLSLFGDGATVHGMPLINILATGVSEPSAVLAIVDCKFVYPVLNFVFK